MQVRIFFEHAAGAALEQYVWLVAAEIICRKDFDVLKKLIKVLATYRLLEFCNLDLFTVKFICKGNSITLIAVNVDISQ